ncbi:MAG: extracellular solute-binding protein [Chloroflexi bacterium]|nr:extracellular solute-binding protein [Chloroflexota bacterium]
MNATWRRLLLWPAMASVMLAGLLLAACSQGQVGPPPPATTPAGKPGGQVTADWKDRWDKTVAAAKQEGKIMVYSGLGPEATAPISAKFRERFGIEVEHVIGRGNESAQRLLREYDAGLGLADVFIAGGGTTLTTLKPRGVLAPLEPRMLLPEVTDPKAWPEGKIAFLDKDRLVIPLNAAYTSYTAFNTDMVKEGQIKSYRDLLKPEWKGKMDFFDPTTTGAAGGWVTFIMYNLYGPAEGEKYLRQFAAQDPTVLKEIRQQVEWVARGKFAIGVGVRREEVSVFSKMGAPIKFARFSEGGQVNPGGGMIALVTRPAHPNGATVMLNWLLTAEGQAVFSQGFKAPAVRVGVPTTGIDPDAIAQPGEKIYWTDEEFFRLQGEYLTLSKEIFGPVMK